MIWMIFGTIFEYCETSLLLFYAHSIADDIFPDRGVISIYMLPIIAIVFRPLGGYFIGRIGDRDGADAAMRISAICMSVASMMMSVIPSYNTVGLLAPILLVFLRGVQMMSAGGELNFAAITLIENSKYKNFASGIAWSATSAGWLIGYIIYCILGQNNWRIAFFLTSLFGLLIFPFRTFHKRSVSINKGKTHSYAIQITCLLSAAVGAFTYYALQYCRSLCSFDVICAYIFACIANIIGGYLNDVYGKKIMYIGLLLSLLSLKLEVFLLYPIVLGLWKAPTHAISYELFGEKRCSRIALWYSLGTSITGQGTMLCCTLLDRYYPGSSLVWGILAVICGAFGLWMYENLV